MPRTLFGQTLGALIAQHHGSGREFARLCDVDSATISRLIAGETRCSLENLRVFCEKISPQALQRYELLLAHLHDEAEASGLDVSRLLLRHVEGVNLSELELSPEMNGQLGVIARAAGDIPEVAESVEALSGLICRYRAMQADQTRYPLTEVPALQVAEAATDKSVKTMIAAREKKVKPPRPKSAKNAS